MNANLWSNSTINSVLKRKYLNINNIVFLLHDTLCRTSQFVAPLRLITCNVMFSASNRKNKNKNAQPRQPQN